MTKKLIEELSRWRDAAVRIYNKWDIEYDACIDRNNRDITSAKIEHTSLPEHYWNPLHKAFVRREAAKQLLEIIREVETQVLLEQKSIELEREKKEANIEAIPSLSHTNIRV